MSQHSSAETNTLALSTYSDQALLFCAKYPMLDEITCNDGYFVGSKTSHLVRTGLIPSLEGEEATYTDKPIIHMTQVVNTRYLLL